MERREPDPAPPEAASGELDPLELRAWRAFLASHALISRRLETELLERAGLPLAEYDVLVQLAYADDRRLRMHELADRVLLSRGGLTRLVDRLVSQGLVERAKCGLDARGAYAVLTTDGLERLRAASPCHLDGVRRYFSHQFDAAEQERLAELLERTERAAAAAEVPAAGVRSTRRATAVTGGRSTGVAGAPRAGGADAAILVGGEALVAGREAGA